jgi:hypothetical protein
MLLLPEIPRIFPLVSGGDDSIYVPSTSGANVFFTSIGIPLSIAG